MDLIERVVADDPETLDLLNRAMQRPHGGDRRSEEAKTKIDNVKLDPPDDTSRSHPLRKLRKDAPELHAKVLAKEMTAHAAMVKAGFRHPTITIPIDHAESIARTLKRKVQPPDLPPVSVDQLRAHGAQSSKPGTANSRTGKMNTAGSFSQKSQVVSMCVSAASRRCPRCRRKPWL